jgi:hypothetical protein
MREAPNMPQQIITNSLRTKRFQSYALFRADAQSEVNFGPPCKINLIFLGYEKCLLKPKISDGKIDNS